MSPTPPGRVLSSGYNTRIDGISADLRSQWLGGGHTVWRRDQLEQFPQRELNTRWAIGEDLRFSYPVGKVRPLFVCAAARARHSTVHDQAPPAESVYRYRGRKAALAYFYFVAMHPELSRAACFWMLSGRMCGQFILGAAKADRSMLLSCVGQAEALAICALSVVGLADLHAALEDRE